MNKQLHGTALKAQEGINLIEKIVLSMGSRWTPGGPNEVGIDGIIELFESGTGKPTGKNIAVQSKALSMLCRKGDDTIEYWCDRRDIEYWLQQNLPVILVVSKPDTKEAYWACIQERFSNYTRNTSPRVLFNTKSDIFCQKSWIALNKLGLKQASNKPYLDACPPVKDRVISNLLPVSRFSDKIYHANTEMRYPREVWQALHQETCDFIDGAWLLHDGGIFSFADLHARDWKTICDEGTIETFEVSEWSDSTDDDSHRLFVQLLNRSLKSQLSSRVRFWPMEECFAFLGGPSTGPVTYHYKSAENKSCITVVSESSYQSADGREFTHYRHLAFRGRFRRFSGIWYLEVTPTYRFTRDGYHLYRFHEDQLKGIKRIEGNRAVLSQILVWADLLGEMNELWPTMPRHIEFGRPLETLLPICLQDSAWGKPSHHLSDGNQESVDILELPFEDGGIP